MQSYDGTERDPFIPHQCMFWPEPRRRCGSYAMHNEYFCYHHRTNPTSNIVPCDEFELTLPHTRDSIQKALVEIAVRLAAKTIDDRRAGLILYSLQIASCNLPPHPRPATEPPAAPPSSVVMTTAPSSVVMTTAPSLGCHDHSPLLGSHDHSPFLGCHDHSPFLGCHSERSEEPPYSACSATQSPR